MSEILEEDVAGDLVAADFSQLLDLPDIAFSGAEEVPLGTAASYDALQPLSPSQLEPMEYATCTVSKLSTC